jgi:hypothetical protein
MKKFTMIAKITAVVSGVHLRLHIKEICALSSNNPRADFSVIFDCSGRCMVCFWPALTGAITLN